VKSVVLDASALMTFFEGGPAAEKVADLVALAAEGKRQLLMSVINWGEVYYTVWRKRGPEVAQRIVIEIAQLPVTILNVDRELTRLAAEFHGRYKLPYVDCFAAALANQHKAQVATSDRDFARIASEAPLIWI